MADGSSQEIGCPAKTLDGGAGAIERQLGAAALSPASRERGGRADQGRISFQESSIVMRRRIIQSIVWAGILLCDATVALARAGGGGGYSGGGSSSSSSSSSFSSSSSSSGGGGGRDLTLVDLVIWVVIIAVVLFVKRQSDKTVRQQTVERRSQALEWASVIRERDPDFDLDAFGARVKRAFLRIQEAWSNQDLEDVRGFMSDGVHERFSIQLREQASLGYRNPMSNVRVRELDLVDARSLAHFDVVCVRITASALDFRVGLKDGREIAGTRRTERFTEIWSFLRGHDPASKGGEGLFEGQCPNCAAPVDPKRAWACESCGSELDGAPADWVLIEITQASEWSSRSRSEPDWLKTAIARDPGLTTEQLEDRASVLYWRRMDAERTGSAVELASVARPLFLEHETRRLEAMGDRFVGDCAVGSVALRGIVPGEEWDLALVEMRWEGGGFERRGREPAKQTGSRTLRRSLLVMARRADARSQVGRCVVSAHCASCGAPDEGNLEGRCGFCDEPLNDGRDWLIDRFLHMNESEARTLLAEVGRPRDRGGDCEIVEEEPLAPGGAELFGWCLAVVYANQQIHRRERLGLERMAKRLGLPKESARKLRMAAQFGKLEVETPSEDFDGQAWLATLEELADLDGRRDRHERAVLERLSLRISGAPPRSPLLERR